MVLKLDRGSPDWARDPDTGQGGSPDWAGGPQIGRGGLSPLWPWQVWPRGGQTGPQQPHNGGGTHVAQFVPVPPACQEGAALSAFPPGAVTGRESPPAPAAPRPGPPTDGVGCAGGGLPLSLSPAQAPFPW